MEFLLFASFISFGVLLLIGIFVWHFFHTYEDKIAQRLKSQAGRIERSFVDAIDHTAYMMSIMNAQVKQDPKNLRHIDNILNKFKVNPNTENLLSWTIFSWADAEHFITVDAIYGIMEKPFDLSIRDYIPFTKAHPGTIQLGKPVYGSTSKRWMIPGGMGVADASGKYLGAMTIGFDIMTLKEQLREALSMKGLRFGLVDRDQELVLKSDEMLYILDDAKQIFPEVRKKMSMLQRADDTYNTLTHINIYEDTGNYLAYPLAKHPYILYVEYDNSLIAEELWDDLTSRVLEVVVIAASFLLLFMFLYKRLVAPLAALSDTADQISRGVEIHKFPRSSLYETANLSVQLMKLQRSMRREKHTKQKLEEAVHVAKSSDKARERFARKVRHKMERPMRALAKALSLSAKSTKMLNRETRQQLEIAHNAISQLQVFVTDDLALAHIDIKEALEECLTIQSKSVLENGMHIYTEISAGIGGFHTDEIKFKQIITGLLTRSIDFSPHGTKLSIIAKTQIDDDQSRHLEITIQDNGFGFDDETRQLWEARDEQKGYARRPDGTDSSLETIQKLVGFLNGSILYKDIINKGSTIIVSLPYLDPDAYENNNNGTAAAPGGNVITFPKKS